MILDIVAGVIILITIILIVVMLKDGIRINRILKNTTHWSSATIEQKKEVWEDYQKRVAPMLTRRSKIDGCTYFIAETFEELDNYLSERSDND